jgi:hypothetical protein
MPDDAPLEKSEGGDSRPHRTTPDYAITLAAAGPATRPPATPGVAGSTPSARIFAITELKSAGGVRIGNRLGEEVHRTAADDSGATPGKRRTQAANLLSRDLARDAAVEQQDDQRHLVRIRGTRDLLRGHAGAERQAVDAFREQQELEDRKAELIGIVRRRREQDVPRVARRRTRRVTSRNRRCARSAKRSSWKFCMSPRTTRSCTASLSGISVLLEELAQALADEELGQMVLQLADAMLRRSLTAVSISDGSGAGSSTASPSIDCSAESASGTTAPARQPSTRAA